MERITTGTFVALALSAALGYAAPRQQASAAGATTITGCIQRGPTHDSYVLVETSELPARYELVAEKSTNLSTMVGRKVDIVVRSTSSTRLSIASIRLIGSAC
jgi:hypothetical protein